MLICCQINYVNPPGVLTYSKIRQVLLLLQLTSVVTRRQIYLLQTFEFVTLYRVKLYPTAAAADMAEGEFKNFSLYFVLHGLARQGLEKNFSHYAM